MQSDIAGANGAFERVANDERFGERVSGEEQFLGVPMAIDYQAP